MGTVDVGILLEEPLKAMGFEFNYVGGEAIKGNLQVSFGFTTVALYQDKEEVLGVWSLDKYYTIGSKLSEEDENKLTEIINKLEKLTGTEIGIIARIEECEFIIDELGGAFDLTEEEGELLVNTIALLKNLKGRL
jgi:hypothetical protein